MKLISVPPPVKVKVPRRQNGVFQIVEEEESFYDFLLEMCGNSSVFRVGKESARQLRKIRKIVDEQEEQQAVEIAFEEPEYANILKATTSVEWLTSEINEAYVPFYDAIDEARTLDNPKKAKEGK